MILEKHIYTIKNKNNSMFKRKKEKRSVSSDILTVDILTNALSAKFGYGIIRAKQYAYIIMDIFGYEDRIVDNILIPRERKLFYMLEKANMLLTEREEVLLNGKCKWRLHYWIINKDKIHQYANQIKENIYIKKRYVAQKYENIYFSLPDGVWRSNTQKI